MLWGIYSAIYGEVNVSVEKCVEIKGDYVEKQQSCFISLTLKSWTGRKILDPTTYSYISVALFRTQHVAGQTNSPPRFIYTLRTSSKYKCNASARTATQTSSHYFKNASSISLQRVFMGNQSNDTTVYCNKLFTQPALLSSQTLCRPFLAKCCHTEPPL